MKVIHERHRVCKPISLVCIYKQKLPWNIITAHTRVCYEHRLFSITIFALLHFMVTYLLAGKLTPAAKVEVQVRRQRVPWLYAASINLRSSIVSPPWWYAIPYGITRRKTGQIPSALLFNARNNSCFSETLCFFSSLKMQFYC